MNPKLLVIFCGFIAFVTDYCATQDDDDVDQTVIETLAQNYDQNVISAITSNYNNLVRPNRQLAITLRMSFRQLVSLDEKSTE